MATFKEHDFVRFKKASWTRKYSNISLADDNIFEIKGISSKGYKLDLFDDIIPVKDVEPVPIDGKADKNVYYDPLIAASFVGADEVIPEQKVEHSYYLKSFRNSYYTEDKTLYDIVISRKYKYVHEVQQWLRREYTWEELKIDHDYKKIPEVFAMRLRSFKDEFVNNGVPDHLFIYELCNLMYIKYVSDNGIYSGLPYDWNSLKEGQDCLLRYDSDALKLKVKAYLTSDVVLKNVIIIIDSITVNSFDKVLEELIKNEVKNPGSNLNQYYSSYKILETAVNVLEPTDGELWDDPAAGTCGTMIAIDKYLKLHGDTIKLSGCEIYAPAEWIGRCNLLFHGISCNLEKNDVFEREQRKYDGVICDIPIGSARIKGRDSYPIETSNRLLNFILEICESLKDISSSRAAFVLPDSFFFQSTSDAVDVKSYLFSDFHIRAILRLPKELMDTSVNMSLMFIDRVQDSSDIWIYNARKIAETEDIEKEINKILEKFVSLQLHYQEYATASRKEKEWRKITKQEIAERNYCFNIDELYKPVNSLKDSKSSLKDAIKLSKDITKDLQSLYRMIDNED